MPVQKASAKGLASEKTAPVAKSPRDVRAMRAGQAARPRLLQGAPCQPEEEARARDAEDEAQRAIMDEKCRPGERERRPGRVADQRAKLHEERGPKPTRQPAPERLGIHRPRRGIVGDAEAERGDNQVTLVCVIIRLSCSLR